MLQATAFTLTTPPITDSTLIRTAMSGGAIKSWEEMMIPFLGVIVDPGVDPKKVIAYPREFSGAGRK